MALANASNLLFRMLTLCCAATVCSAATAQSPALSAQVGFADADVCPSDRIKVPLKLKNAPDGNNNGNNDDSPIHLEADDIETEGDNRVILRGSVEVVRGKRGLYAERIVYHRDTRRVRADGDVLLYTANGDEIRAATLDMEVDTHTGEGSDVHIRIADDHSVRARAVAQSVRFAGDFQHLNNVTMTTCAEGNQDVLLSAREIELDHAAGVGTAKSMTVKFKQTPIFYFPTATFPINDKRKTGFLFPSAGYDNDSGAVLETPYYLNLAPHYDATITPRVLSKRGAQLSGEFRHLSTNGRGNLRGEFLPSDNQYNDQDRYAFGYDYRHAFADDWRATLDWQTLSDSAYLRDFANEVEVVASSYVPKKAGLDYFGKALRFSARAATYDSVNDDISRANRPYETLPQLSLELKPQPLGLFQGGVETQYGSFRHDHRVHGTRLRVKPYVSARLAKSYGYIEPKVSLQAIGYSLDNPVRGNANTKTDASPSAEIAIYSIDSRLFFERQIEYRGAQYSQTLEPRLLYLSIPEKSQQGKFPDFDTGTGSDSSFAHFFRENRFFGGDRVGDTEQIAVGATSRVLDNHSGRQRLTLSVGQVFYLQDRVVGLPASNGTRAQPETAGTSGVFTEVGAAIAGHWNVTGFARLNEQQSEIQSFRLAADYRRDPRRTATAAYTFSDDSSGQINSEQINMAFQAPLRPGWQLQGSGAYSLAGDEVRSSTLGVSFDGCCWAARVAAQRYLVGTGEYKNRLAFTFELDDLGRIGSRL